MWKSNLYKINFILTINRFERFQYTYIHHNYHFRLKCTDFSYFLSNFLCTSDKIHCWCMFRIRLGMAYILVVFYHHNNHLDNYSSIFLRMQNVRYDMLCIAFPMNHCTLNTTNDTMHNCFSNKMKRKENYLH